MTTVGYMVIRREDKPGAMFGRLMDDWDGIVHATQGEANEEAIKAKRAGYDVFTVRLVSRKITEPQK